MTSFFQGCILRFHVNLPGCTPNLRVNKSSHQFRFEKILCLLNLQSSRLLPPLQRNSQLLSEPPVQPRLVRSPRRSPRWRPRRVEPLRMNHEILSSHVGSMVWLYYIISPIYTINPIVGKIRYTWIPTGLGLGKNLIGTMNLE